MNVLTPPLNEKYKKVYTVTQLNRETSLLLGEHFMTIWVEGEISNLSAPSSGHLYFSLKDAGAQIRCAMFRNQQRRLVFKPENGKQVLVKAEVSLYEPRGDYQLIVETIEESGYGALQRAFDALKIRLAEEGLFDPAYKKSPPVLPKAIGIITTPTGAAIRDILSTLKRRFAAIPVVIYPAAVQGESARFELARAIVAANKHQQCDVLILARGGGSLEDLWPFNEEMVARAIFASSIPIISGVGHETDVTIADFAADLRAATPTAAAEHASPDQQQWLNRYQLLETRLDQQIQRRIRQKQQTADFLTKRLLQQHPGRKLAIDIRRLNELDLRLKQALPRRMQQLRGRLDTKSAQLWRFNPAATIKTYQLRHQHLAERLVSAVRHRQERFKQRLLKSSQTLHAVSPLATLNRGYAMAIHLPDGTLIRSTSQLAIGDRIQTRIAKGRFTSEVTGIEQNGLFSPEFGDE